MHQIEGYILSEFIRMLEHFGYTVPKPKKDCLDGMREIMDRLGLSYADVCGMVRQCGGDRAVAIYRAKCDGWWKGDACADIRKAPGDRALAIYWAKCYGWWEGDACADIREAPGERVWAIYRAKRDGWWEEAPC